MKISIIILLLCLGLAGCALPGLDPPNLTEICSVQRSLEKPVACAVSHENIISSSKYLKQG